MAEFNSTISRSTTDNVTTLTVTNTDTTSSSVNLTFNNINATDIQDTNGVKIDVEVIGEEEVNQIISDVFGTE